MTSEARAAVDRHYAAINGRDRDGAVAVHSDDADCYMPGAGAIKGREGFMQASAPFFDAFPDAQIHGDTYIDTGDAIVVEGRFTGTHTAPLMSPQGEIPATGNTIDLHFADIFRVEGDEVVWHHVYFDRLQFMEQLGLMP